MKTFMYEGEEIQIPENSKESAALTLAKLQSLPPGFLDRLRNPPIFHINIGKTEYVVNRHYNPNGTKPVWEQLYEIILQDLLNKYDKHLSVSTRTQ